MDEPSVMATENVLMAAALTPGTTVIHNAACEPHVQDLARLLVKMGAGIDGIGSNLLTVEGAERLGGCDARDRARPHRDRQLHGACRRDRRRAADQGHDPHDLRMICLVFDQLGLHSEFDGNDILVPGGQRLVVKADFGGYKRKVMDGPWPAFPADLTSDRGRAGDPGRGLGADPRMDVREPPDLHRQARDDGRRHRALRSASRDRHRPAAPARRRASSRPTSAPAWRC